MVIELIYEVGVGVLCRTGVFLVGRGGRFWDARGVIHG
jgi:hypothetical protein